MKFRNSGRLLLASVVSFVLCFGITSCSNDYTVGYLYVTSSQYNQIQGFKIDNNHGKLTPIGGPIVATGGTNPIRILLLSGGRYLYVLNGGCGNEGQAACANGAAPTAGNIEVFSIGGYGQLSAQQTFSSQGTNPIRMTFDGTGKYLYVLDKTAPDGSGNGEITAFSVDQNTGRLTLITNLQVTDQNGTNLPYFPVGKSPVGMKLVQGFIFVVDGADQTVFPYKQDSSTGQLTEAQSGPQSTGATNISLIGAGANYVYLLDAGNGTGSSTIFPYTVSGSNGALQTVVGGTVTNLSCVPNPTALYVESKNKYLYITNGGPSPANGTNCPSGNISGYVIQTNGTLEPITAGNSGDQSFKTGAGPQCIVEDPTNQYFYVANYDDGTVSANQIDNQNGLLFPLHAGTPSSYTVQKQPTWCIAISN